MTRKSKRELERDVEDLSGDLLRLDAENMEMGELEAEMLALANGTSDRSDEELKAILREYWDRVDGD